MAHFYYYCNKKSFSRCVLRYSSQVYKPNKWYQGECGERWLYPPLSAVFYHLYQEEGSVISNTRSVKL